MTPGPARRAKSVAFVLFWGLSLCGLAGCGPANPKGDLQKLTVFHQKLLALDADLALAGNRYTGASNAALNRNDNTALHGVAGVYRGALARLSPVAARLRLPDFANGHVSDHARNALGSLLAEIDARTTAADAVLRLTDPKAPDASALAAAAAAQQTADSASAAQGSEIVEAYGALDVTPDKVDTVHGGLKRARP